MRRFAVLALVLLAANVRAADAADAGTLDDTALGKRLDEIAQALKAKNLQQGEIVDPAQLKDQLDALDQALSQASDPRGESANKGHLLRAQVLRIEGKGGAAEAELKALIDAGASGQAASYAYYLLGAAYAEDGRTDDLTQLAAAAKKAGLPDEVAGRLQGMATSAAIAPGKPFPDFSFTDTAGVAHQLSDYKGKVLLVDFWATWCGPCVQEMPNVKAAYDAYHARGFEIVGISLDQERTKLDQFVASKGIPWPQAFDGKGWSNEIAMRFGIQSIPAPFLVGPDGVLIAKGLRGDELKEAIEKALPAAK